MTEPIDPQSKMPTAPWQRLRRFFHLEGKLGGLRYEARLSVIELQAPTIKRVEDDTMAAESADDTPAPGAELHTWESEGGALMRGGQAPSARVRHAADGSQVQLRCRNTAQ